MKVLDQLVNRATISAVCLWFAAFGGSGALPAQEPDSVTPAITVTPGTKVAFTEYNWGGLENVNGAVAQADILGIFGKYCLDLATLWGPPDPVKQTPGLMAYEIYRNYDGKNSMFGDMELNSNSADQRQRYYAPRQTGANE